MIRQEDLKSIIKAAEKNGAEVCGFLLGSRDGETLTVEEVRPITNRLKSPTEFEMEQVEMVESIDLAEERGLEVVGIFHSHLKCPPRPNGEDLRGMRLWPVVWLIVDEKGNYGAFVLEGDRIQEVGVEVPGRE